MTMVLTSPSVRWVILGGMLLIGASFASSATADDETVRPAPVPDLLPVPDDEVRADREMSAETFKLPPSPTTEKLVLVSAEIDAQADQPQVSQVDKGSSSRRLRKVAINDLPTQHLTPQQRQVVGDVLDSLSVFRRLPAYQCELDPRVHEFFIQHPDVAVSIWRAMAISQLQMTQRNPFQYDIDTQDGTTGVVTVLHQTRDDCLVHCEGMFKSPYLKSAIRATSLMRLKTSVGTDRDGRTYVTQQADLFVSFPSQKVGTIAKLISPVSNAIIDRNFEEISLFTYVMWQAMTKQPGWVEQIAGRLDGVAPVRKDELIKLTADVYVTAQTDTHRRSGLPVSLEVIRPPEGFPARAAVKPPVDVTR